MIDVRVILTGGGVVWLFPLAYYRSMRRALSEGRRRDLRRQLGAAWAAVSVKRLDARRRLGADASADNICRPYRRTRRGRRRQVGGYTLSM